MNGTHLSDEVLLMAIDGELPERRTAAVADHLSVCPHCRERSDSLRSLAAEALFPEPTSASLQDSHAALALRMAETLHPRRRQWMRSPWLLQTAVVTLATILAFTYRQAYLPLQEQMAAYEDTGPEPNQAITPGAVRAVALSELCTMADNNLDPKVSPEKERAVFAAYGLNESLSRMYQVDYLINPQLGGDDTLENLWPEPYHATVWNADAKDALEARLHGMVCNGQIGLREAQREIAADWIGAYKAVFHTSRPVRVQAAVDGGKPR